MSRPAPIVGVAAGPDRIQVCHGTVLGDLPDPRLRLAVREVTHDGAFPRHAHHYTELVLVLAGRAEHLTAAGARPLRPGDVLVLHGRQWHGFGDAVGLRLCNVQFDPGSALPRGVTPALPGYRAWFTRRSVVHRHLGTAVVEDLARLAREIGREIDDEADGRVVAARGLFQALIARLCRASGTVSAAGDPQSRRLEPVFAHIRAHLDQRLPVARLAQVIGVSASQLERLVRRATGRSLVGQVTALRLAEAKRLLVDPSLSIAAIAARCGFRSPAFFAARFRACTGLTPTAFRRQVPLTPIASRAG